MSTRGAAILALMLLAATAAAQRSSFEDARQRTSYALGVDAARQFKARAIDLDPDAFTKGLKDALSDRTLLLTDDEVEDAIAGLRADIKRREFLLRTDRTTAVRAASDAFLAENRKKQGVVTLPTGLQYKVLKAGQGPRPGDTDTVECNYRGTLIDGAQFDSSNRGGSSPSVKIDEAIAGLREALKLMPVGSTWQVFVPPSLVSGPRRATVAVPPDQVLIYEIELLAIK